MGLLNRNYRIGVAMQYQYRRKLAGSSRKRLGKSAKKLASP